MSKLTHNSAMDIMARYFLFKRKSIFVIPEVNILSSQSRFMADLIVLLPNDVFVEIEVKTTLSDFKDELKTISYLKEKSKGFDFTKRKILKFESYFNLISGAAPFVSLHLDRLTPNKFYYAVPREFIESAEEVLKNTFIGIIQIESIRRQGWPRVIKRAKTIHDNHCINNGVLKYLIKTMSYRYYRRGYEKKLLG